ncbi:MAG: prenyltransferase/squalene oxidase repeat-containing protein [Planctomycetota bacterium]
MIVALAAIAAARAFGQSGLSVEIALAIDRGVQKILTLQRDDGTFGGYDAAANDYPAGVNALAVYTLLKSGIPASDPAIQRTLPHLKQTPFERVYVVATLIMALDALNDRQWDALIAKAAAWLEESVDQKSGLWGYPHGGPDLSNTQFAALALWTAERHGHKARTETWSAAIEATLERQNADGGFGYRPGDRPESGGSTTTAAIVILAVGKQRFTSETGELPLARAAQAGMDRAWAWLEQNFSATGNPAWSTGRLRERQPGLGHVLFHYYFLYGLERATALAHHGELIGGRNWYEEGALHLLAHENGDGGFSELINTCFALLFLRRATFTGMTHEAIKLAGPRAEFWRYTTVPPPGGWTELAFDDASWTGGAGAFGKHGTTGAAVRTAWTSADIWLRRAFDWKPDLGALRLFVLCDDGCEIYLNGVLAASQPTWTQKWIELLPSKAALAALRTGQNLLAAHAQQWRQPGDRRPSAGLRRPRGARARASITGALVAECRWPSVPFLRQWLTLGPFDNADDRLLNDCSCPMTRCSPRRADASAASPGRARVRSQATSTSPGQ